MRILSIAVWLALFSFLSPLFVKAVEPPDVVFNEIAWMGTKINDIESKNWWRYEWLELYNNTKNPISLDGWKIELYRTNLDWSLEIEGNIPANGYFLVVSSDKIFPGYDLNYSNLGGKLNNNGQKVLLKNDLEETADEIDCFSGGKWFAGDNATKQTMERKDTLSLGNEISNWQTSKNPNGSPKAKNNPDRIEAEPQKTAVYPSNIFINELLPSPDGPDETEEWIEIINQNDFETDLSGWKISDTIGQVKTYFLPENTKITAGGFLVLSRKETGIILNNSGDKLNISRPDGKIIDEINYGEAPQNKSFNRNNSGWFWSKTLTPNSQNLINSDEGIKQLENAEDNRQKEEDISKNALAAIRETVAPGNNSSFPLSLPIGLTIAIFSGFAILILKKKIKQ